MWTALLWSLVAVWLSRFLWRRWKYDLHKIPCPPGLPILGHTLSLTRGEGLRDSARWVGNALKRFDYPKLMRASDSYIFVAFGENGLAEHHGHVGTHRDGRRLRQNGDPFLSESVSDRSKRTFHTAGT